jgi:hypothetical protein
MADTTEAAGTKMSAPTSRIEVVSSVSKALKDVVAGGRDAMLFSIGIMLLFAPTFMGDRLTKAGFAKGEILGFEWKARTEEVSTELSSSQAAFHDLKDQYDGLKKTCDNAVTEAGDAQAKVAYVQQIKASQPIVQAAVEKQENAARVVASTLDALNRAPEKLELTAVTPEWAIVLGADRTLPEAQTELREFASVGFDDMRIYSRQNSFRTVAKFDGKEQATSALRIAMRRRKDAYIVDLRRWCPKQTAETNFTVCSGADDAAGKAFQ